MKFALVSHVVPPSASGQAIVLYRLLRDLPKEQYCVIHSETALVARHGNGYTSRLRAKHYQLRPKLQIGRFYRRGFWRIRQAANSTLSVLAAYWHGVQIARICRAENCQALIPCTGDLVSIPASLVAHRLTGIALFPYLFDYFSYQWTTDFARAYAGRVEARVFEHASGIITPNEFMVEQIRRRYNVESSIVRNPVDMSEYCHPNVQSDRESKQDLRIVYTGAVYEAHFDAFRNLVEVISTMESPKFTLHVYSRTKARVLEEQGIMGPVVLHDHLPSSAVPEVQVSADVLFLPLAFESKYPEVINTSAPGKMGEYLASGRPILVHAPRDSFVAWYFNTHHCGVVVDQPSAKAIQSALEKLHGDSSFASLIVGNALKRAQDDFSLEINRRRFAKLLDISAGIG